MKLKKKPEVMSPAGDWACLTAALRAGADAVYFGLRGLNMRSNYRNFLPSEMPRIARECHQAGARVYLALNTIIYENELAKVDWILQAALKAGIDAVIAWDMGVIKRANALGLPIFFSTQASVSNSEGIAFYHRAFGIRRFVLARECTLAQIRTIRRKLAAQFGPEAVEIEVFAHGAMCVSVSGRCFISEERFGKSANRGACLQPCRREYRITDAEGEISLRMGNHYLLSPEDLCVLPFIEQLLAAGVASLKIEGRARTPEYVATVTAVYRKAVDFYFENQGRKGFLAEFAALKETLMKNLESVYHRGLSPGFYMGQPLERWTDTRGSKAAKSKRFVGEVMNYYRKAGAAEIWVRDAEFAVGDELIIQGPTTGAMRVSVESIQIEHGAREKAVRGERVAVRIPEPVRCKDRVFLVTERE